MFDGGDADATVYLMDETNPSLLMIDLDEPNAVRLGSDTVFVVSNSVGDAKYGGLLCKGVWDGGGKNLEKQGVGLMTIDFRNTPETAFSKIQVAEGEIAILKPIYAESITKKDGICSVCLGSTDVEASVESAVKLSSKLSVGNVNLFVPSYAGGATWYGAVVAGAELAPKKYHVFVRDDQGTRLFDGRRYREIADATINAKVPTADGRVTFGVTVPVQNVTVLTDRQGSEQTFDSSVDNGELVALLKSGGKLQIKDANVSVDDASHTVTIDGVAYTVPSYYGLQLEDGQISKTLNESARPVLVESGESADDAFVVAEDEVVLSLQTQPGLDYTVQSKSALGDDSEWVDGESIPGDGTVKQLKAEKVGASGFYRVKATD